MNEGSKMGAASAPPPEGADAPDRSATPAPESFAALFEASVKGQKPGRRRGAARHAVGDRVEGRITSLGQQIAVIELADGSEGTLDVVELRDDAGQITARVGDRIDARISALGEKAGSIALRRSAARGSDARAGLGDAAASGLPVEGLVTAANKGGLEVMVAGVRAFCPMSQIDLRPVADPTVWVGQKLAFRITKLEEDRRGPNVVLSRRALLEEDQRARAVATREKLAVGAVLPGVVTGLKDFGAFVDLGGIDGLLPASEIGFQRGARPGDVLSLGQTITVQVLRIETRPAAPTTPGQRSRSGEQITLSLKSLEPDPWDEAAATSLLLPGTTLRGRVTRVEPFGAFVELVPGVEGLIHISELGAEDGRRLQHAREAVKPGAELEVTVQAVDRERRRIALVRANAAERIDDEGRAAVARAAPPARLGTLGDLLKGKLRG